jgi:hypothetical protein
MGKPLGHTLWAIPEGYIPSRSTGPAPAMTSPVPLDTDYASVFSSDVPIVVQHTRLDSRQAENALLSTMAFPIPS